MNTVLFLKYQSFGALKFLRTLPCSRPALLCYCFRYCQHV